MAKRIHDGASTNLHPSRSRAHKQRSDTHPAPGPAASELPLRPARPPIEGDRSDEVLSPDEEQFVTAFVDYWLRRGALIVDGGE